MWEMISAVIKSKNEINNVLFKSMFMILWHFNTLWQSITLHTYPLPLEPFVRGRNSILQISKQVELSEITRKTETYNLQFLLFKTTWLTNMKFTK